MDLRVPPPVVEVKLWWPTTIIRLKVSHLRALMERKPVYHSDLPHADYLVLRKCQHRMKQIKSGKQPVRRYSIRRKGLDSDLYNEPNCWIQLHKLKFSPLLSTGDPSDLSCDVGVKGFWEHGPIRLITDGHQLVISCVTSRRHPSLTGVLIIDLKHVIDAMNSTE